MRQRLPFALPLFLTVIAEACTATRSGYGGDDEGASAPQAEVMTPAEKSQIQARVTAGLRRTYQRGARKGPELRPAR